MSDKNTTVTVIVPHGYRTTNEFLTDCGLESVENPLAAEIDRLQEVLRKIRIRADGYNWRMADEIASLADEGRGNYD